MCSHWCTARYRRAEKVCPLGGCTAALCRRHPLPSPIVFHVKNGPLRGACPSAPLTPDLPRALSLTLDLPLTTHLLSQATSSTLICMPQHRNTANRIFGGFLMHRAYEVAFCAAFMFGGSRPRFSEIDEVHLVSKDPNIFISDLA